MGLYDFRRVAGPPRNLVQTPEIPRKLARFLGMREAGSAPTMASEIQPVIVVGDVSKDQVEDVQAERPYGDGLVITGLVGDLSHTWHFGLDKAIQNQILILDRITVTANVNTDFAIAIGLGDSPIGASLGSPKCKHTGAVILSSACTFSAKQNQPCNTGLSPSRFIARRYILARAARGYLGPSYITTASAV